MDSELDIIGKQREGAGVFIQTDDVTIDSSTMIDNIIDMFGKEKTVAYRFSLSPSRSSSSKSRLSPLNLTGPRLSPSRSSSSKSRRSSPVLAGAGSPPSEPTEIAIYFLGTHSSRGILWKSRSPPATNLVFFDLWPTSSEITAIEQSADVKNKQSSCCRLQTFGPPLLLQRLADMVRRLQMFWLRKNKRPLREPRKYTDTIDVYSQSSKKPMEIKNESYRTTLEHFVKLENEHHSSNEHLSSRTFIGLKPGSPTNKDTMQTNSARQRLVTSSLNE
ncbi:hypothetical protein LXL04_011836 [Taraxacum kok-saghyz]